MKQVFRKGATERNRRKFYRLCDDMHIEQNLLEPPTTADGGERSGVALHIEPEEYHEMVAVSEYFEIFRAGVVRVAFRIGMAAIVEKMTELYPPPDEGIKDDEKEGLQESAAV